MANYTKKMLYKDRLHIMKSWRRGKKASFEQVLKNFGIIELTRFEKLVLKSKMNDNYNNINEDK